VKKITLISWNINGIRAAERKGFLKWLDKGPADIVGVQEIKAKPNQLGDNLLHPDGYESYWNPAIRPGYSGTAIYTKIKPKKVQTEFKNTHLDGEGRVIMAEYDKFYFLNVYFPNGKSGALRLGYKMKFYDEFLKLIERLRKKKPIIFCGDVNTAHTEIDLARPKANEQISGFLPQERAWIDKVIAKGYIDVFRHLHPKKKEAYSWWSQRSGARARNVGWRIDYFFVSKELEKKIVAAEIHSKVIGSDHCPVSLTLRS
jgi:exodeoxyribonuclease-3